MDPPPDRRTSGVRRVKLAPPRVPAGSVRRRRREADLERAADLPLTVLAARAGFGKTSLLAAWAGTTDRRVAWLSVDETDADVRRFAVHLVAAIRTAAPYAAPETLAAMEWATRPDPAVLGEMLADELLDLPAPVVVVIDDLHLAGPPAAQLLATLLQYPSPAIRWVIGCRQVPDSLDLRRLRSQGQVAMLGEEELRLDLDEIDELLGPSTALRAVDVMRRTDGWPAGVRAIALGSASAMSRPPESVQTYLEHDVLAGQPEELVAFLRQVSVVDRVSPGLAGAITGGVVPPEAATRLLAEAEARGLFVSRLDGDWWRLHPLLRDVLQDGIRGAGPSRAPAIDHEGAIRWLVEAGEPVEAVAVSLRVGLPALAADVMAGHIVAWLTANRFEALGFVEQLPQALVEQRPELLLARAALHVMRAEGKAATAALRRARALLADRGADCPDSVARTLEWEIVHLGAAARHHGGDPLVGAAEMRALMDRPAGASPAATGTAGPMWGLQAMIEGRWDEAEPVVRSCAMETIRGGGMLAAWTSWAVAALHLRNADAVSAAHWLETADLHPDRERRAGAALPMWFYSAWSWLLMETGDLREAERLGREGLDVPDPRLHVHRDLGVRLARILGATGRHEEAAEVIAGERRRLHLAGARHLLPELDAAAADLALAAGNPAAARRWADSVAIAFPHDPLRTNDHPAMAQARIWLHRGAPEDAAMAVQSLTLLQGHCERLHDRLGLARTLPLLAAAHAAAGDPAAARAAMREALEIEPGHLSRRFLDAGPWAIGPLREIAAEPGGAPVARAARQVLEDLHSAAADDRQSDLPSASPLTGRQTEIVALMAHWMTDKEIAVALGLSSRTVSKHIENILRRLDATDRRDAVAIAHDAGWIEATDPRTPGSAARPVLRWTSPGGLPRPRRHAAT